jgi:hypothetical protein
MKKIVVSILFTMTFLSVFAQKDFQGMAVYESKTSTSDFKKRFEGNKEMTPEMQKMIEERKDLEYSTELREKTHRAIQEHIKIYNLPEEIYNNVTVYHKDGTSVQTYATRLKFLGADKFKGWKCYAGVHRINIGPDSPNL